MPQFQRPPHPGLTAPHPGMPVSGGLFSGLGNLPSRLFGGQDDKDRKPRYTAKDVLDAQRHMAEQFQAPVAPMFGGTTASGIMAGLANVGNPFVKMSMLMDARNRSDTNERVRRDAAAQALAAQTHGDYVSALSGGSPEQQSTAMAAREPILREDEMRRRAMERYRQMEAEDAPAAPTPQAPAPPAPLAGPTASPTPTQELPVGYQSPQPDPALSVAGGFGQATAAGGGQPGTVAPMGPPPTGPAMSVGAGNAEPVSASAQARIAQSGASPTSAAGSPSAAPAIPDAARTTQMRRIARMAQAGVITNDVARIMIDAIKNDPAALAEAEGAKTLAQERAKNTVIDETKVQSALDAMGTLDQLEELVGRFGNERMASAASPSMDNAFGSWTLGTMRPQAWNDRNMILAYLDQLNVTARQQLKGQGTITQEESEMVGRTLASARNATTPEAFKDNINLARSQLANIFARKFPNSEFRNYVRPELSSVPDRASPPSPPAPQSAFAVNQQPAARTSQPSQGRTSTDTLSPQDAGRMVRDNQTGAIGMVDVNGRFQPLNMPGAGGSPWSINQLRNSMVR